MSGIGTPAIPGSGGSVGSNVTVTNFPVTQPVSGTVTANQGTSPWVVSNGGTFAVQATQSGIWTMQPGNTANTTPWLVKPHDGTNPLFKAAAALADATANPTIGGIQTFPMVINSSGLWDR